MRILLADDQPKVRFALNVLLDRQTDIIITGEAADALELLKLVKLDKADMIIIDWMLPGLSEIGSLATLREYNPALTIIAISGRPELGQAALEAGADAFISKIDPPDRLLAIVNGFLARPEADYPRANSK